MAEEQSNQTEVIHRESRLNQYATHVSRLSQALNERAKSLTETETRVAQERKNLQEREASLNELENRMRREMNAFIKDIAHRQRSLATWEKRRSAADEKTRRNANTLLDSSKLVAQLHQRQLSLSEIESKLFTRQSEVSELEQKVKVLRTEVKQLQNNAKNIVSEKEKLNNAATRLRDLEERLNEHATEIRTKENAVNLQEQQVKRFRPLQNVISPLQLLIREFQQFDESALPFNSTLNFNLDEGEDMTYLAESALQAAQQIRKLGRDVQQQRTSLQSRENNLREREKTAQQIESRLRNLELSLESNKQLLSQENEAMRKNKQDLDDAWNSLDESRKEVDRFEDMLRKKEENLDRMNQKVKQREISMAQLEKTLLLKEKSLQRARNAITMREKSLDQKEVNLDTELEKTQSMKKAIGLRESILEVRDLELSTREAGEASSKNRFPSRTRANSAEKVQIDSTELPHDFSPAGGDNREEILMKQRQTTQGKTSENKQPDNINVENAREAARSEPVTVRRQLAFESTRKKLSEDHNPNEHGRQSIQFDNQPQRDELPDDESEIAASQLLPELTGARSLWLERVIRLQTVVQSMSENQWIKRPHVDQALANASEKLRDLRDEIEKASQAHGLSSKEALASEQSQQAQWSHVMKEQLDNVREVQTAMIIGLNSVAKDTADAGSTSVEETGTEAAYSLSAESINSEDVVDDTLDATAINDSSTTDGDSATDISTMTQSFRRFREEMRSRQQGLALATSAPAANPSPLSNVLNTRNNVSDSPSALNRMSSRLIPSNQVNIFTELTSLRNDLDSITGIISAE